MNAQTRIGIYAGTFDPVHAGHITFALQSLQAAELDKIYFLPERQPRSKQNVEHFGHRVAMLKSAIKPHPQFEILELTDVNFSIEKTLPKLKTRFSAAQLVFLFGSDILPSIQQWPKVERLLPETELVIGLRQQDNKQEMHKIIESWPIQPRLLTMFPSHAPGVSSGQIREALRSGKQTAGVLASVERYSNRHWLYVSIVR